MADEAPSKMPTPDYPEGVSGVLAAPMLYSDWIGGFGHVGQIVNLTLCANKHLTDGTNNVSARYVVAHLRLSLAAALAIKDAIGKIELSLQPPASAEKN